MDKELLQAIGAMMDEKLEPIKADISSLKEGQAKLEVGQAKLQKDVTEMKTSLKYAWEDTNLALKRIKEHEKTFHNVG